MPSVQELPTDSYNFRLFTIDLNGTTVTTTVTSTPSVVRRWISTTLHIFRHKMDQLVVGMGVQWTPGVVDPPADTLQLCVGRRCLVFHLTHAADVPNNLRNFLLNPNFTFVGIWNHSDSRKLFKCDHEIETNGLIDLRHHVTASDGESLSQESFETIALEFLGLKGVRLDHEVSRSDWGADQLGIWQVYQATIDAYVSFEIGKQIDAWEISDDMSTD